MKQENLRRNGILRGLTAVALSGALALSLCACMAETSSSAGGESGHSTSLSSVTGTFISASDIFTDRDLEQTADLSAATTIALTNGEDATITEEGVYLISGSAKDCTIIVEADDSAKVQLVLDGVSIENADMPAIYVKSADKVFITTTEGSSNSLVATGDFATDGDTNLDAVIFSKDDLTLNGLGSLSIESSANGLSCKDDLKVTGGTYSITSAEDGMEAHDSIAIAGGEFTIGSSKDAIHSEDDEDDTVGYIYIGGGTFKIDAEDDGIQATTFMQIDGGSFEIDAVEAIEGTYVQINAGTFAISASDDGINATDKSASFAASNGICIEITGGEISISMAQGDTDAVDSNGDILSSGGTIDITAQSPFDYVGTGELSGGTVTVNGQQVTQLSNQMMGGMGGMQGGEMGDAPNASTGTPPSGNAGEAPDGNMGTPPSGDMGGGPGKGRQGQ
ncbi:MAG: carbohydrate-binding domain-containing protein [Coriobacteriales bacterium]|nr:carbohydrate-binding domain-containing protein [Coriobacteriales bacterium]